MNAEPEKKASNVIDAVILFADVIGSLEIANERGVDEYYDILSQFHNCARNTSGSECAEALLSADLDRADDYELSTRGDEVCLILHPRPEKAASVAPVERLALALALALKFNWLATRYNSDRIADGLLPRDLAVGIHKGKIRLGEPEDGHPSGSEGYTISLAKRVEGEARRGRYTRCFVTREFERACLDAGVRVQFADVRRPPVKGVSLNRTLRELRDFPLTFLAPAAHKGLRQEVLQVDTEKLKDVFEAADPHTEDAWLMKLSLLPFFLDNRRETLHQRMQTCLELYPDYWEAHFQLGQFYSRASQRYELATTELEEAERLNPGDALISLELANAYGHLGRLNESQDKLSQAEHVEQNYASRMLFRGQWLLDLDKHREAIQYFSGLLDVYPKNALALWFRAAAKHKGGDNAGAEEDYKGSCEIDPAMEKWGPPWESGENYFRTATAI